MSGPPASGTSRWLEALSTFGGRTGSFTRTAPPWRLSIIMETAFCVEALQEALEEFGGLAVLNGGKGSQFKAH
jgi:hypothetical protein